MTRAQAREAAGYRSIQYSTPGPTNQSSWVTGRPVVSPNFPIQPGGGPIKQQLTDYAKGLVERNVKQHLRPATPGPSPTRVPARPVSHPGHPGVPQTIDMDSVDPDEEQQDQPTGEPKPSTTTQWALPRAPKTRRSL